MRRFGAAASVYKQTCRTNQCRSGLPSRTWSRPAGGTYNGNGRMRILQFFFPMNRAAADGAARDRDCPPLRADRGLGPRYESPRVADRRSPRIYPRWARRLIENEIEELAATVPAIGDVPRGPLVDETLERIIVWVIAASVKRRAAG